MKFKTGSFKLALLCIAASVTAIGLMAWTGKPLNQYAQNFSDTIPSKKVEKEKSKKDFDKELKELEKTEKELSALDEDDWDDIGDKIEEAIGRIDFGRIELEIEEATKHELKDLDKEINQAMRDIDWNELSEDIEESMQDFRAIDFDNLRDELHDAKHEFKTFLKDEDWKEKLDAIDWKEFNDDLTTTLKDLKNFKPAFDKNTFDFKFDFDTKNLADEIRNLKEEMKGYKEMVYEMEKDKLLNTDDDYKIEYKKGELFINDKKQSDEIVSKYRKYFKTDQSIIKKNGNINLDTYSGKKKSTIEPV